MDNDWDEENKRGDSENEEAAAARCPFCNSDECCAHELLDVDVLFHDARGGVLKEKFTERWFIDVATKNRD